MAKEITIKCEVTSSEEGKSKRKGNRGCGCFMLLVSFLLLTSTITYYICNHRLEQVAITHALIVLVLGCSVLVLLAFVICGRSGGESSCDDGGLPYPLNKYV